MNKRHPSAQRLGLLVLTLVLAGVLAWPLWGSSPPSWQRYTFGNGGGRLQTGLYTLEGTVGQPSAVGVLHTAQFQLNAGYWGGAAVVAPPAGSAIYLPLVVR